MIALDDNEKLSINNVLEVIIGVGTLHPRVFLLILTMSNIVLCSAFKHRTDWCSISCLLYLLIICFQIIVSQYYNYDINISPIIWLPLFPVE